MPRGNRRGLFHHGLRPERTQGDFPQARRERGLAERWALENDRDPQLLGAILRGLDEAPGFLAGDTPIPPEAPLPRLDQRDVTLAATLVQWLGTNVGFSFLAEALEDAGYSIVETDWVRRARDQTSELARLREQVGTLRNERDFQEARFRDAFAQFDPSLGRQIRTIRQPDYRSESGNFSLAVEASMNALPIPMDRTPAVVPADLTPAAPVTVREGEPGYAALREELRIPADWPVRGVVVTPLQLARALEREQQQADGRTASARRPPVMTFDSEGGSVTIQPGEAGYQVLAERYVPRRTDGVRYPLVVTRAELRDAVAMERRALEAAGANPSEVMSIMGSESRRGIENRNAARRATEGAGGRHVETLNQRLGFPAELGPGPGDADDDDPFGDGAP